MSQSYLTYYEAFDVGGNAVYGGNAFTTSTGLQITENEIDQHNQYVLRSVQQVVPSAVTIVFKGFFKL